MGSKTLLAACAALTLATTAGAACAAAPANVAAAVADRGRPADDVKRDALRKPAEMLAFAGVKPGMTVVDFLPGGGYFTRLFAKAVGPKGTVFAAYPPPRPPADPAKPPPAPAVETLAADPAYANVRPVRTAAQGLALPAKADVFWTSQNYHDLHNIAGLDLTAFNKAVFDALKPGGVYVVLDHVAAPGDPEVTRTLHRIDPAVVRKEVEAAGFRFVGEDRALRNSTDNHTLKVFDPAIRGRTDQFIYKFKKPG
jgi:predicted methyltransferase